MIMSLVTKRRATVWNARLVSTTERKPPLARGHRAWLDLSRDTRRMAETGTGSVRSTGSANSSKIEGSDNG